MKCAEMIGILNELAPEQIACTWDNVGLLAGRREKQVEKLLLCLDVTDQVIQYGMEHKIDMIVSHHPLLFRPVKNITDGTMIGRRLLNLIQGDISYYAMHTNFDCAEKGMAYAAANRLGLQEQSILDEEIFYENAEGKKVPGGIGRIGKLQESMSVEMLQQVICSVFQIEGLMVYGKDLQKQVSRVAISPGSGKDQIEAALQAEADVLITGDISHHSGLDAKEQGLVVIDAGHYNIEHIFSEYVAGYLREKLFSHVEISVFPEERPYTIY